MWYPVTEIGFKGNYNPLIHGSDEYSSHQIHYVEEVKSTYWVIQLCFVKSCCIVSFSYFSKGGWDKIKNKYGLTGPKSVRWNYFSGLSRGWVAGWILMDI